MVFNDPHLPWETVASNKKRADESRNKVPWLAVFVCLLKMSYEFRIGALEETFDGSKQDDSTLQLHCDISQLKSAGDKQVLNSPLVDLGLTGDTKFGCDLCPTRLGWLPTWYLLKVSKAWHRRSAPGYVALCSLRKLGVHVPASVTIDAFRSVYPT